MFLETKMKSKYAPFSKEKIWILSTFCSSNVRLFGDIFENTIVNLFAWSILNENTHVLFICQKIRTQPFYRNKPKVNFFWRTFFFHRGVCCVILFSRDIFFGVDFYQDLQSWSSFYQCINSLNSIPTMYRDQESKTNTT